MNIDFYSLDLIKFSGIYKFNHNEHSLIALYFSAHWCPPSRIFTPKLISLYNLINTVNSKFEVISISFDRDQTIWDSYFEEIPWPAVPFNNENQRLHLLNHFKVENSFKLLIFTNKGKLLTCQGVEDLKSKGFEAFDYWMMSSDSMSRLKSPPFCPADHLMVYVNSSKQETCKNCSNQIVIGWECPECQHLICETCQEWLCNSSPEDSEGKCLNFHTLRLSTGLNEFYLKRFLYDKYNCRTCNELQSGEGLHCRPCLFDICLKCFKCIGKWKTFKKSKCASGHELIWKNDLCMILQKKFKFCQFRCEDCGESFLGGGAFACMDCEFYRCVKCFSLFNKES